MSNMISVPLPDGDFVISPQHTDRRLLLNPDQARKLIEDLTAELPENV